jgi:hypothetical protein
MGAIYDGVPHQLALRLKNEWDLHTFVETGTWGARTAIWAAQHFDAVYTIELSENHYQHVVELYGHMEKIEFILGDSRVELSRVLEKASTTSLIFLDAHWSCDLGYDRPGMGECPLLEELAAINASDKGHVILIDDARYFTNGPGEPHLAEQWPAIEEVMGALGLREIWIEDDVIVAVPH